MDLRADATLPCSAARARTELAVLDAYPAWLGIVQSARPAEPDPADTGPAWWVDLGARIGPLRRTKLVRMVRTRDEPEGVRFERREVDGRPHPEWVLEATMEEHPGPETVVELSLHYGGSASLPMLDAVLGGEVRRAGKRLSDRVRS